MKKYLFIAAAAALALASCQQEKDINVNNVPAGENSVSFVFQSGAPTRSGDVESPVRRGFSTKVGEVDGQSIYLEETITDLGSSSPETKGTPLYTENLGYLYRSQMDVHTSTYTAGDVTYYQIGDGQAMENYWCYGYEYPTNIWGDKTTDVDFAFRMPSSMTSHGVSGLDFDGTATTFTYKSPETAVETQDIVFGGVTKTFKQYHSDYAKYGGSKVTLFHALTGVKFAIKNPKVKIGNVEKLEYGIQIDSIFFIGLANGGTCTFTPASDGGEGGSFNWTSKTTQEGNKIYQKFAATDLVDYDKDENSNHFADSFYDGGITQNINDAQASKTFWLVPQAITGSDAKLRIFFSMNGVSEQYMEIRLGDLKASDWQAGQIRTYTFRIDEVNVKIDDSVQVATETTQKITVENIDYYARSFEGSYKEGVVITNTGNTDAYIRAALIGQWLDFKTGEPVFGYTDFTGGSIKKVESWYQDQFQKNADEHVQGLFEGLVGYDGETSAYWELWDDGYYYYKYVVPADNGTIPGAYKTVDATTGIATEVAAPTAPDPQRLFQKYTVLKTPAVVVGGVVKDVYFVLEIATQAISAKKLDGTYYTLTEAWDHANSQVNEEEE